MDDNYCLEAKSYMPPKQMGPEDFKRAQSNIDRANNLIPTSGG
jgi:hypothetical protein